jgi:hypothetical protein
MVTFFDTEFWIEKAWIYALKQNTQMASLGITDTDYLSNPTISDELPFPHVEVECVAVSPASANLQDKTEICEVEITVRTSKGIDADDSAKYSSTQRHLLGEICGAVRQVVLYDDDTTLRYWLTIGGNNRSHNPKYTNLPLIIITNTRYQPENITCVDVSTAHYHARRFTVTTAGRSEYDLIDP